MSAEEIKKAMRSDNSSKDSSDYVSFGSTQLNLAVTGHPNRGIQKGTCVLMAGDSDSGKTWITLATLAEASINKKFEGYRLIYNGPENGAKMDIHRCFGRALGDSIEMRTPDDGTSPRTAEEFYDQLDDDIDHGVPFIQILDSMDAIRSDDELDQIDKEKKARRSGREATGSYGTAKAKINSARLPTTVTNIGKMGSILIIISQLKDTIGFGAMFNPKYRSGGKSLKFFAHTEVWLANRKKIERKFNGIEVQVGAWTMAKCVRSRHTGRKREVNIPILYDSGIDDVGGMVQFLVDWGHWKKSKETKTTTENTSIVAPEFDYIGKIEKLCEFIDAEKELVKKLKKVTWEYWKQIEEETSVNRRNKYSEE